MSSSTEPAAPEVPLRLSDAAIGRSYRVVSFGAMPPATARRLESVGMTVGTVVTVLNNKSRGTVVVRVRETRWAMGRAISSAVAVVPAEPVAPAGSPRFVPAAASCLIAAPAQGPATTPERGGGGR